MDRRGFLGVASAAAVVLGFDPLARRWVSAAEASPTDHEPLPPLDGSVATDEASIAAASHDEGNIIRRRPWAVLRPGSVDDIAAMIRYCRRHGVQVAARGQGHAPYGQAQVEAGLVIEMATLATIHSIEGDRADVDAGVTWKELFQEGLARGVTPPQLTGFIGLSIGGTLSMAGVGGVNRTGLQVDHVRALQVVTGEGRIIWCSPHVQRDLFEGALMGMGQLGIITRAVVDLVPAPARVAQVVLQYTDPEVFFRDLYMLLERNEAENIYGSMATPGMAALPDPSQSSPLLGGALPALRRVTQTVEPATAGLNALPVPSIPEGTWVYQINVAKSYTGAAPNLNHLLRGVRDIRAMRQEADRTYAEFSLRVDYLVDLLKAVGLWNGTPRPWIDVFIPGQAASTFVPAEISRLNLDDVGFAGFVLLFPLRRSHITRRFFPPVNTTNEWIFLFDVLTAAPFPGAHTEFVARMLRRNRGIYDRACAAGGTVYPISAVDLGVADWQRHYGAQYDEFVRLKRRFDPSGIMTPGRSVTGA